MNINSLSILHLLEVIDEDTISCFSGCYVCYEPVNMFVYGELYCYILVPSIASFNILLKYLMKFNLEKNQ